MMIKTDVSVLYKTKLCKKFSANGYCPYGMRCQFIHEFNDPNAAPKPQPQRQIPAQNVQAGPPLQLDKVVSYSPSTGVVKPAEAQASTQAAAEPSSTIPKEVEETLE